MRIIAIVDNDDLGLVAENEILGASDATMCVLVDLEMAEVYDDTKPIVGKSINVREEKSYPPERQVFHGGNIYKSNTTTATTFVLSEWDVLVTGAVV